MKLEYKNLKNFLDICGKLVQGDSKLFLGPSGFAAAINSFPNKSLITNKLDVSSDMEVLQFDLEEFLEMAKTLKNKSLAIEADRFKVKITSGKKQIETAAFKRTQLEHHLSPFGTLSLANTSETSLEALQDTISTGLMVAPSVSPLSRLNGLYVTLNANMGVWGIYATDSIRMLTIDGQKMTGLMNGALFFRHDVCKLLATGQYIFAFGAENIFLKEKDGIIIVLDKKSCEDDKNLVTKFKDVIKNYKPVYSCNINISNLFEELSDIKNCDAFTFTFDQEKLSVSAAKNIKDSVFKLLVELEIEASDFPGNYSVKIDNSRQQFVSALRALEGYTDVKLIYNDASFFRLETSNRIAMVLNGTKINV